MFARYNCVFYASYGIVFHAAVVRDSAQCVLRWILPSVYSNSDSELFRTRCTIQVQSQSLIWKELGNTLEMFRLSVSKVRLACTLTEYPIIMHTSLSGIFTSPDATLPCLWPSCTIDSSFIMCLPGRRVACLLKNCEIMSLLCSITLSTALYSEVVQFRVPSASMFDDHSSILCRLILSLC